MPEDFDAYHKWLGIPPHEQPPNYYRLLGISLFESDVDVISNAADQRMAHVRTFQTGSHALLSQRILNEIAAARVTLLDPHKKTAYDQQLRALLAGTLNKAAAGSTYRDVLPSSVADGSGLDQSPVSVAVEQPAPPSAAQPPAPPQERWAPAGAMPGASTPPSPAEAQQQAEHMARAAAEALGLAEQEVRAARAALDKASRHKRRLYVMMIFWYVKIVYAQVLLEARKWAKVMPLERQGSLLIGVGLGAAISTTAAISLGIGGLGLIASALAGACVAALAMVHLLYVPRDERLVVSLTASRRKAEVLRAEVDRLAPQCAQAAQAYRQAVARCQQLKKQPKEIVPLQRSTS